jgi:signal transduction histidine kinase
VVKRSTGGPGRANTKWTRLEPDSRFGLIGNVLLWLSLIVPAALVMFRGDIATWPLRQFLLVTVVLTAAVVLSHPLPIAGLVLAATLWTTGDLSDDGALSTGNLPFALATAVMSFLVGRRMVATRPALATYASLAVLICGLTVALPPADIAWFTLIMLLLFLGVLPWLLGRHRRSYRRLIMGGWERAERLEREQRILAEQTRLRERSRIAQDMHDSLGHELSLIALLAGGLEVAPTLSEEHRRTVTELRSRATIATERLREVIGVLRERSEHAPVAPVHETVPQLIDRARSSGMTIDLAAWDLPGELSPMVDRAVYRVVQETLTNATKHAPGAPVTVRLERERSGLVVTVDNDRAPAGPVGRHAGDGESGHGLGGLRERVGVVGGTFSAQPRGDGGFRVVARLPQDGMLIDGSEPLPATAEPSVSTGQRQQAERGARRSLIVAIATPALIALTGALVIIVLYTVQTLNSVLKPSTFEQLRIGQPQAEINPLLPENQYSERPRDMVEPTTPTAATCRYYRASDNLITDETVYRLCFRDGRLVAKDELVAGPA